MQYKLTKAELKNLINASEEIDYIVIGETKPRTPYERSIALWAEIGKRKGFDYTSVKPIFGKSEKYFDAVEI